MEPFIDTSSHREIIHRVFVGTCKMGTNTLYADFYKNSATQGDIGVGTYQRILDSTAELLPPGMAFEANMDRPESSNADNKPRLLSHRATVHSTLLDDRRIVEGLNIHTVQEWMIFEAILALRVQNTKCVTVDIMTMHAGRKLAKKERLEDFFSWAVDEVKIGRERVLDYSVENAWKTARKVLIEEGFCLEGVNKIGLREWEELGVLEEVGLDVQWLVKGFEQWEAYVLAPEPKLEGKE